MMTRRHTALIAGSFLAASLSACSTTKVPPPAPPVVTSSVTKGPDSVKRVETVTVQATVVAINQKTRMVTLRGPEGNETTFRADDSVKNLKQVKKGDLVTASYYRAIAGRIRKPGEATAGVVAGSGTGTAALGQMPAGVAAETVQITGKVTKIDRDKQEITLHGPKGKTAVIAVQDPSNLDKVKKGDMLEITYTEAVAISVDKAR